MKPVAIALLLFLTAFLGCKQNDLKKDDASFRLAGVKTLSTPIGNVVVRAKITRLQSAGGGSYNYAVSLYVADIANPGIPLRLPGDLTVKGTLTDGLGIPHNFTVTLKEGTTTTTGNYVLPWPVVIQGASASPSVYNGIPIDFTGTFYEDCTNNFPGMIYDVLLADSVLDSFSQPAIACDGDGNAYVFGLHNVPIDADPGPGVQMLPGTGGFIIKLSPAGSLVWAKNISGGGMAMQIAVDKQKNIYLEWYTASQYHADDFNLVVAKLDASGNMLWQNMVTSAAGNVDAAPLVPDDNGNLYVGGYLLTKFSPGGNMAWQDKLFTLSSASLNIAGNKLTIWGTLYGTQDVDPGTSVFNIGSPDNNVESDYIASFDTSGKFITAKASTILPIGSNFVQNGTIGFTRSNVLFRTDANLDMVWQHTFNFYQALVDGQSGMVYSCFTGDINANSYVCGIFNDSPAFNDSGAAYMLTAKGQNDFIEKRDASGNFVWAIPTHPFTTYSQISVIQTDAQENIYTAGMLMAAGKHYIFIDKLSQCN